MSALERRRDRRPDDGLRLGLPSDAFASLAAEGGHRGGAEGGSVLGGSKPLARSASMFRIPLGRRKAKEPREVGGGARRPSSSSGRTTSTDSLFPSPGTFGAREDRAGVFVDPRHVLPQVPRNDDLERYIQEGMRGVPSRSRRPAPPTPTSDARQSEPAFPRHNLAEEPSSDAPSGAPSIPASDQVAERTSLDMRDHSLAFLASAISTGTPLGAEAFADGPAESANALAPQARKIPNNLASPKLPPSSPSAFQHSSPAASREDLSVPASPRWSKPTNRRLVTRRQTPAQLPPPGSAPPPPPAPKSNADIDASAQHAAGASAAVQMTGSSLPRFGPDHASESEIADGPPPTDSSLGTRVADKVRDKLRIRRPSAARDAPPLPSSSSPYAVRDGRAESRGLSVPARNGLGPAKASSKGSLRSAALMDAPERGGTSSHHFAQSPGPSSWKADDVESLASSGTSAGRGNSSAAAASLPAIRRHEALDAEYSPWSAGFETASPSSSTWRTPYPHDPPRQRRGSADSTRLAMDAQRSIPASARGGEDGHVGVVSPTRRARSNSVQSNVARQPLSQTAAAARPSRELGRSGRPRTSTGYADGQAPASGGRSRLEASGGVASLFGGAGERQRTSSLLGSISRWRSNASNTAAPGKAETAAPKPAEKHRQHAIPRDGEEPVGQRHGGTQQLSPTQQLAANHARRRASTVLVASPGPLGDFARPLDEDGSGIAQGGKSGLPSSPPILHANGAPHKGPSTGSAPRDRSPESLLRHALHDVPRSERAAVLAASADGAHRAALRLFMRRFSFGGDALDIALRKLLMSLSLPRETQQIDRVMEAFAQRYNDCNEGLFESADQPYILAFSLMMLHTDAFNKNAKAKMTKADYVRNTSTSGVPVEVLEYLYDNLTFTQFIYVEDDGTPSRRPSEVSTGSGFFSAFTPGSASNKIDPYYVIAQRRTREFAADIHAIVPEESPFSATGTSEGFDVEALNRCFVCAPAIEIITARRSSLPANQASHVPGETYQSVLSTPPGQAPPLPDNILSLRITKVGCVSRKDDLVEGGKKAASRKWKTWGMALTSSQLLFFRDLMWAGALESQIQQQTQGGSLANVVISPRITYFKPDIVLSLADALAVRDADYSKYANTFRVVARQATQVVQFLVQTPSEHEMNDWIVKINFCSAFRSLGVRVRGLDPPDPSTLDGSSTPLSPYAATPDDSTPDTPRKEPPKERPEPLELGSPLIPPSPMTPASLGSQSSSPATFATPVGPMPLVGIMRRRLNSRRKEVRPKIEACEGRVREASGALGEAMRLARHLAICTPFQKATRERIEAAAVPLAQRVRALRLDLAKAQMHLQVLLLELEAADRAARGVAPSGSFVPSAPPSMARGGPGAGAGAAAAPPPLSTPQLEAFSQRMSPGLLTPSSAGGGTPLSEGAFLDADFSVDSSEAPGTTAAAGEAPRRGEAAAANVPGTAVSHSSSSSSNEASYGASAGDARALRHRRVGAGRSAGREGGSGGGGGGGGFGGAGEERASSSAEQPEEWNLSRVARGNAKRISLATLPDAAELQRWSLAHMAAPRI